MNPVSLRAALAAHFCGLALIALSPNSRAATAPAAGRAPAPVISSPAELKSRIPGQLHITKPDYVVFVPAVTDSAVSDTGNEHFLVFDGPDGSLMAVWTQSSVENSSPTMPGDQHIAFARSTDEGVTWTKPAIIAGPRTAGESPIASWAYPLVSKSGVTKVDTSTLHIRGGEFIADEVEGLLADGRLAGLDGIVVPGGFGVRGTEGKIAAVTYAREHGVPFLGLCLGMQCAVIEFARSEASLAGANSSEFDPHSPHPVIDLMDEQRDVVDMGGTMRLGSWPARLVEGTIVRDLYGDEVVYERHRHRYEVNNAYRARLEEAGLVLSGTSPDGRLVEFVELPRSVHPFFVATQAHPEFKSRPNRAHPLFAGFSAAAKFRAEGRRPHIPIDIPASAG